MVQLVRLEEPIPKEKIEELRELLGRAYVGPGKLEVSVYLSQRRVEEPGTVITADVVMKVLEGDIIVPKEHVKWIARYIADVLNLPEDIEETLVTIADAAYDFFGVGEIEFVLFPSLRVFNSAVSRGVLEVAEVKWETPGVLGVSVPSFGSLGGTLEPGTFTEKYVSCYFLLNYARLEDMQGCWLSTQTILLFSFELCEAAITQARHIVGTDLLFSFEFWFEISFPPYSGQSCKPCYFLLNFVFPFYVKSGSEIWFKSLLFSFEFCP